MHFHSGDEVAGFAKIGASLVTLRMDVRKLIVVILLDQTHVVWGENGVEATEAGYTDRFGVGEDGKGDVLLRCGSPSLMYVSSV